MTCTQEDMKHCYSLIDVMRLCQNIVEELIVNFSWMWIFLRSMTFWFPKEQMKFND